MVYYVLNDDWEETEKNNPLFERVSSERMEKINRLRLAADRYRSALVFVLLRYALEREFGYRDMPVFIYNENGKPEMKQNTEDRKIYFNLSHCKRGVACAVSELPVGVDIQDYGRMPQGVAERCFCDEEIKVLESSADAAPMQFAKIWSLKESYGKYLGVGIGYDMKNKNLLAGMGDCIAETLNTHSCAISYTCEKKLEFIQVEL